MDIDLLISLLFIFSGILLSFFSSVLFSLSQDALNEIVKLKTESAQRLNKLSMRYEDNVSAFLIAEISLYAIAFVWIGAAAMKYYHELVYVFLYAAIFVVLTAIGRIFFYALGMRLADSIALKLTPVLYSIYLVNKPLVFLIHSVTNLMGAYNEEDETRDEISALVESAREEGSLDPEEYRLLINIMKFSEVLVADVMTPRTVVFSADSSKTVAEVVNLPEVKMYSRIPLWEGNSLDDGISGYVLTKDILIAALNGQADMLLSKLKREVYFISEDANLDVALEKFLQRRQHLFAVVDEYGGFDGLITMEDVMETILGAEIVDEADRIVDLRLLAKNRRDQRIAKKVSKRKNFEKNENF